MSFGFGTGPFGLGFFGRQDVTKELLWSRTVPAQQKLDDIQAGGDLERVLTAKAELLDSVLTKIQSMPQLIDALYAPSSSEGRLDLDVVSVSTVTSGVQRVQINSSSDELLRKVFATASDGVVDGWSALIGDSVFLIERVDVYERFIDVRTAETITSPIKVQPPDFLSLIGENLSIVVDKSDVPDYSRRALYRHHLLRDLKVTKRLFELIGLIYGFGVTVDGVWCITKAIYDYKFALNPSTVFTSVQPNGVTGYYTTQDPVLYEYDEIAADAIPTDYDLPYLDISIVILSSTLIGLNTYELELSDASAIGLVGNWQVIDSSGDEFWIESVVGNIVTVMAATAPLTGVGAIRYNAKSNCAAGYKRAAAYVITITPGAVLTEPGADLSRLIPRLDEKLMAYIPLHIRILNKIYQVTAALVNVVFGSSELNASKTIYGEDLVDVLNTSFYDLTPADVTPTDQGQFMINATLTVIP